MINSPSITKIAFALVQAQSEMETASKSSKNPFFKSSYADLNSIREVALPALNKHKIAALQPTVTIDGKKYVQTTLLHESGEYISCITEILSLKEHDAQAQGSGITYARRYGLQSLLNIGAEDDDGNAASGKPLAIQPNLAEKVRAKPVTFMIPDPVRVQSLQWIKDNLAKQHGWKDNWKDIMKKIAGVATLKELEELPHESLTEITKLLLTTYKIEG